MKSPRTDAAGLRHVLPRVFNARGRRSHPRGAEWRSGELRQLLIGGSRGRAADLLAVDDEIAASVMFLEFQWAAVFECGFSQGDAWFHVSLLLASLREFC